MNWHGSLRLAGSRPRRLLLALGCWGVLAASVWVRSGEALAAGSPVPGTVVYETTSVYHHIRVVDHQGGRTLCFDDSTQTRVMLGNPLLGHFEYTEYFHLPWLWTTNMKAVLMIGLGGASVQRSFAHYYPSVSIETVEIDPTVLQVARRYFQFKETPHQQVHLEDGRVFLRRSTASYDVILLDAYVQSRYGPALPYHLVTREFFEQVNARLSTNGVVAYNCMGTLRGWQADIVGAVYRTMAAVFPQVYLFPARESLNVVLIGTRSAEPLTLEGLRERALRASQSQRVRLPTLSQRVAAFQAGAPPNAKDCPVLQDDYAPVDGLFCLRP